jgi:hypothetical protein
LPNSQNTIWPRRFIEAINTGSDLTTIWPKFAVWLLTDENYGVLQFAKSAETKKAINHVAYLYANGGSKEDFIKAAAAAADSYDAAAYVAYSAAYAADAADAAGKEKHKIRIAQAEKLIQLLKECEPKQ